jgi:ubiquinone/menaquinone biosynthesis C-methylase UbiE
MTKSRQFNWKVLKEIYDERAVEVASTPKKVSRGIPRKYAVMVEQIGLHLKNGGVILDVGCGSGLYSSYLSQRNNSLIVASDISQKMVMEAMRRIELEGGSEVVRFTVSNLECFPFKDRTFDGIICSQVIEHLLDDQRGLGELYRVLKPTGALIISTDNKNNYISKFLSFPVNVLKKIFKVKRTVWKYPHKDYKPKEFYAMLSNVGFNIRKNMTFRFTLPSPLWQIKFVAGLVDNIERFTIRLPLVKNCGDIILAVCEKPGEKGRGELTI